MSILYRPATVDEAKSMMAALLQEIEEINVKIKARKLEYLQQDIVSKQERRDYIEWKFSANHARTVKQQQYRQLKQWKHELMLENRLKSADDIDVNNNYSLLKACYILVRKLAKRLDYTLDAEEQAMLDAVDYRINQGNLRSNDCGCECHEYE